MKIPSPSAAEREDLALANRMPRQQGVLDGYGTLARAASMCPNAILIGDRTPPGNVRANNIHLDAR